MSWYSVPRAEFSAIYENPCASTPEPAGSHALVSVQRVSPYTGELLRLDMARTPRTGRQWAPVAGTLIDDETPGTTYAWKQVCALAFVIQVYGPDGSDRVKDREDGPVLVDGDGVAENAPSSHDLVGVEEALVDGVEEQDAGAGGVGGFESVGEEHAGSGPARAVGGRDTPAEQSEIHELDSASRLTTLEPQSAGAVVRDVRGETYTRFPDGRWVTEDHGTGSYFLGMALSEWSERFGHSWSWIIAAGPVEIVSCGSAKAGNGSLRTKKISLPANEREVVWLPSGFVYRFTQDREMRRWVREDGPAVLRRHPNEAALERLAGLDVVRFNVDLQGASRRDVLQRLLQLLKPVIIELNREASNDEVGRRVHQHTVVAAAEQLNLSPRAVLHRIAKGEIIATKIGTGRTSAYVIEEGEIDRLKANQKNERSQKAGV